MPSRALMLVNPHSRSGAQELGPVLEVFAAAGMAVERAECPPGGELSSLIAQRGPDHDLVIVGGGDGTLNAALEGLVACGRPLGLLPLGTANDLARTLGIPIDPVAAARAIVGGRVRWVDLGWVNGKHFLNSASMGVSVDISRLLSRDLKRRWGRLGYGVGVLKGWRRARPFTARIRAAGRQIRMEAVEVAVGNGRHFAGGMVVAEDARIDDAQLDLFALEPMSLLASLALVPRLKFGRHGRLDQVRTWRGGEFEVETAPNLPIKTDGEITTATPARFKVCARALAVLVPEG